MTEWHGWAVIKGDELCYVKQEHRWPEVSEFDARQECQLRQSCGENVRLARVRIIEETVHTVSAHEPTAPSEPISDQDPCPKRADGYHDFRHEVCDCGSYRNNTFAENRKSSNP